MNDVLEILFEIGDDQYSVWSENDQRVYRLSRADLEHEERRGNEIVGLEDLHYV